MFTIVEYANTDALACVVFAACSVAEKEKSDDPVKLGVRNGNEDWVDLLLMGGTPQAVNTKG